MKANGGASGNGKDRKRKIACEQAPEEQERVKVPQSASRRHREKINATLEELGGLLPLPEESRSKLDKLTVLKLSVSFFQTQNYLQSGKRKRRVDEAAVNEITKKLEECNINVSDISLEALDSFFLVLSETGDVFFASENVYRYLGYTQTFLMHQNFLNFVHHDDVVGFERCLRRSARARIMELDNGLGLDCQQFEEQPIPQTCFSSIKCHAGRQSSHVSPFYYRSFKFDGHIKPLLSGKMKQYGFFALCTPVNPANPFTSTPKELLQTYSCKMGLDLRIRKLDNRGQKSLFYSDKSAINLSGYMVAHPDDIPCLMLAHQQISTTGGCEIVFRLTNGKGKYQWIRGKARTLYDKNDKPECVTADNVLLTDEQGPFFRTVAYEKLLEWKAKQKGLPSPMSDDDRSPTKESDQDSPLPKGAPSAPGGQPLPDGLPPGGPLPQGRPCPVGGLHQQDGPHPPNRPCPQGESHPPDRPKPLGGPLVPSRIFPPGMPLLPTVSVPPSAMENDGMGGRQGMTAMSDEGMMEDSKDIEIIEYSSPTTAADSSGPTLSSLGLGSSESCMFSLPHMNRSPVEEKPNIAQNGRAYNFKKEPRNSANPRFDRKPNHSAHEQINLIKQFLMGGDADTLSHGHQTDNTVPVNGNGETLHDVPPLWANYPIERSPVLTEISYQQDDRCQVPYPAQNGMQTHFHVNDFHVPPMTHGVANGPQFGRSQQSDTNTAIYPFPPDMNGPVNRLHPYANGVNRQDIPELPVTIESIDKLQNGSDLYPAFPPPEGSLHHSFQPRYPANQNGLPSARSDGYGNLPDTSTGNHLTHDFIVNASVTGTPRQDTSLWFSSPDTAQFPQNMQIPPIDDVLSVDELTPSLGVDNMTPYKNSGKYHNGFHNGNITESVHHPANVFPPNGIHLNQPLSQNFQKQNFQNTPGGAATADHQTFQTGGNSLLKMMLTL